jgi:hypothetical protein
MPDMLAAPSDYRSAQSAGLVHPGEGREAVVDVLLRDDGARSEELAFGPDSRGRRWPRIVLTVFVVIASATAAADARQRSAEAAALVAGIEQSQATMVYAERSVVAIVMYASPALLFKTPDAVRQDLVQLVEDEAADGAASIQVARGKIAAVRFWPWHDDLEVARTAYLEYLDYRTARLVAGAAGSGSSTEFAEHAYELLRAARDALRSALDHDEPAGVSELLAR